MYKKTFLNLYIYPHLSKHSVFFMECCALLVSDLSIYLSIIYISFCVYKNNKKGGEGINYQYNDQAFYIITMKNVQGPRDLLQLPSGFMN